VALKARCASDKNIIALSISPSFTHSLKLSKGYLIVEAIDCSVSLVFF